MPKSNNGSIQTSDHPNCGSLLTGDRLDTVTEPQYATSLRSKSSDTSSQRQSGGSRSTAVSQTSTIEYSQSSFNAFKLQVLELCQLLWESPPPQGITETSPSRYSNRIIERLFRPKVTSRPTTSEIPPSPSRKEFIVERMLGGGFNRIVGISIIDQASTKDPSRLILRVPRFAQSRPDRDVAALRFVRQHTSIPVPDIKLLDLTKNNPLGSPYVIQTRIPGGNLQHEGPSYYPDLNHEQKCGVAKDLGRILREMQMVRFGYAGFIEGTGESPSCQNFTVRYLDLDQGSGVEAESDLNTKLPFFQCHAFGSGSKAYERSSVDMTSFEQSTYYFLLMQFGRWRALELRTDPGTIGFWNYYERLVTMAKQMDDLNLLGDGQNCLCHLDLNTAPRNIMAEIGPDKSLTVSGILDWDSAMFAPRFVGCAPPMWIWAWSNEGEEDQFHANDTPATPEQEELKSLFEDAVGPDFLEYAYRREYRLARKLTQFAIEGINSSTDIDDVEQLLAEWAAIYAIFTAPATDDKGDGEDDMQDDGCGPERTRMIGGKGG